MVTPMCCDKNKSDLQSAMEHEVTNVENEAYRLEACTLAATQETDSSLMLQNLLYGAEELQRCAEDYKSSLSDKNAAYPAINRVVDYATKIVKELDSLCNPAPQADQPADKRTKSSS